MATCIAHQCANANKRIPQHSELRAHLAYIFGTIIRVIDLADSEY